MTWRLSGQVDEPGEPKVDTPLDRRFLPFGLENGDVVGSFRTPRFDQGPFLAETPDPESDPAGDFEAKVASARFIRLSKSYVRLPSRYHGTPGGVARWLRLRGKVLEILTLAIFGGV
jgi:hypothetical protein